MGLLSKEKSRGQLEDAIERRLAEIARTLIGTQKDSLKAAYDYQPAFFGGKFPALGIGITATRGSSRAQDFPNRPAQVEAQVFVFDVSMPMRGPRSKEEDREGTARKRTRRIRDAFIEAAFRDEELRPFVEVAESRGGDINDIGEPITDEKGEYGNLLWLDRTDLVIQIP